MIREVLIDAIGLLLPTACAGCAAEGRPLCTRCRAELVPDVLSRVLPEGTRAWSGLAYEGVVRRVILAVKQEGRTGLARDLAPALAAAVAAADETDGAVLCPIPPTRAARRRRGYDPLGLVVRYAGLTTERLLRSGGPAEVQKGLTRAERVRNTRGVFVPVRSVVGLPVVLIDDVITTGSTLAAAAGVLTTAGAEVRAAIAIASTPLRYGRPATLSENRP